MTTNTPNIDPWKVLIVDDDADVHEITEIALKRLVYEGRTVSFINAYSSEEAIEKLIENDDIAVALVDVVMETDSAGLELVKIIREALDNSNIRIVIRTGNPGLAPEESVTLNYDINDYRGKTDLTAQGLRTMVITALRAYKALITIHNLKQEIDDTQKELIYALGEIAETRSTDNGYHVKRVGIISTLLARKLGFTEKQARLINLAASMHDVGKLAVDDKILNKPGKLTDEEFEKIKEHSRYGYELLNRSKRELLNEAAIIAYEHHENYDGTGYPRGLKSDTIKMSSRIVALVDVFDALATKRVYKEKWEMDDIINFIKEQKGLKFDPVVVDVFLENIEDIKRIFFSNI